jgi:hypothetical protein
VPGSSPATRPSRRRRAAGAPAGRWPATSTRVIGSPPQITATAGASASAVRSPGRGQPPIAVVPAVVLRPPPLARAGDAQRFRPELHVVAPLAESGARVLEAIGAGTQPWSWSRGPTPSTAAPDTHPLPRAEEGVDTAGAG